MSYLTAAILLVGGLCLLDLILTVAVIRRLREHDVALATHTGGRVETETGPAVGDRIGEFRASTVNGGTVSRDGLVPGTLVAVLSPRCRPCKESIPDLVSYARGPGAGSVLVVVAGDRQEADDMVSVLSPVAPVVVETPMGPVSGALGVRGFPTFCRFGEDGIVESSGIDLNVVVRSPSAVRAR